ncbi:hypothetical protein [Streptomyces sp. NPDC005435]|uniref:HflX-like GTP-binding protein n=1 Tax=Streptomyces sp. NPDC005435 TaxID=3154464 RepID=UPI0034535A6B
MSSEPARYRAFRIPDTGADVVLVGYFSAKQKDFDTLMASAAAELEAHGARVVARIVQRRGVSSGGARKMALPYSSRTLLSHGKVRELAQTCARTDPDAVIFTAPLTTRQRHTLPDLLGHPVATLSDLLPTPRKDHPPQ